MSYVLLVEDHAMVAFMLKAQLETMTSLEVAISHDSPNAFERLDHGTPALAFLDVRLEEGTSFGIAERLQQLNVPTFFVTSYSRESLERMGMPAGLAHIPVISKTEFSRKAHEAIACLGDGSCSEARS